jgi:hypothetical protein
MPPVGRDQLVIGQQYYIRDRGTFQGPWGSPIGLRAFTYDGGVNFHVTEAPGVDFFDNGNWLFFPIAGGVPVPPPVVAPAPPPLAAALPDGGPLFFSEGAENVVSMEKILNGDQLVNWNMNGDPQGKRESNFGHYYKVNTYNQLPNPKQSPTTRARINTKNPKRYTASLRVVNAAFPKGSANAGLFNRARSSRKRKGKSRKNKRS